MQKVQKFLAFTYFYILIRTIKNTYILYKTNINTSIKIENYKFSIN